ncbi:DUF4222 domain-containing protein [Pantoea agglomerans]|uniref:DUF4222 domain-containing protein n=1 Tax=Enterobacter agglomerans TaxID=549 RepID=UPI00241308B8|nr:DUF4222 domain-containing protein [Pantoea agglomerans]
MDERFVDTDKRFKDRRGIVVNVISYDRQERRVIFKRPNYEHLCCVPKWYFEKYFREIRKDG